MTDPTQNPQNPQNPQSPHNPQSSGEGSFTPPPAPPPNDPGPSSYQPYPSAPAPGYGPPPTGAGQPGELGMRFLARLIDFVLLGIVNFVVVGAIVLRSVMDEDANAFTNADDYGAAAVYSILTTVITWAYFAILESRNGQTIGKMLLKLRTTQGANGAPPSLEQAFKRNAFVAIGLLGIIPFLGFIAGIATLVAYVMVAVTINSSPTRQGWHDNFAGGTQVVKTG
jgi:uncharacterized RDD family membrane protein YckC